MNIKIQVKAFVLFYFFSVFAINAQETDSLRVELKNLGEAINSRYSDFAPIISADGSMLLFTSERPVTDKEKKSGKPSFQRIFSSYFQANSGTWSNAIMLEPSLNAPGRNNSAISLSGDGKKLLIFRDDNKGNGDIYESILNGSNWSEAVKLPEPVNSSYHESSACYSPDGNTIYFVSNRKGGYGGRDIWQCTKLADGTWGPAINMGNIINSNADEEGVFLHPDGKTLYFSSKSHQSLGGYDIFKSKNVNGQWTSPYNMGKSVNSDKHDVFFVLSNDDRVGFLASSATGGLGEEDIYEVRFIPVEKPAVPTMVVLRGIVTDKISLALLEASIELTENPSGTKIALLTTESETGKYAFTIPANQHYDINVTSPGYLFRSENVFIPETPENGIVEKNISLEKLEVGTKIVLSNIFYDFDKSTLRDESIAELDRLYTLLHSNESMVVEISSHTDGLGTDEYNSRLSQSRAQSVVDYLTMKGIDKNRLVAKGYGKSVPISTNETEEGRQLNRRTEFKIISK